MWGWSFIPFNRVFILRHKHFIFSLNCSSSNHTRNQLCFKLNPIVLAGAVFQLGRWTFSLPFIYLCRFSSEVSLYSPYSTFRSRSTAPFLVSFCIPLHASVKWAKCNMLVCVATNAPFFVPSCFPLLSSQCWQWVAHFISLVPFEKGSCIPRGPFNIPQLVGGREGPSLVCYYWPAVT